MLEIFTLETERLIIRPFVTSIPRESLEFTLTTTRRALSR
mgnify:CR=1 FL=1